MAAPAPAFPFRVEELLHDPYPVYARLRKDYPVVRVPRSFQGDWYFVCRYDDAVAVLKDESGFVHERKRAGLRQSWVADTFSLGLKDTMIMRDGDDHRRLRNLVHQAFTPARVEALRGRVEAMVALLCDRMQAHGEAELIADFALPLPIAVICDLMGVPDADRERFRRQVDGLIDLEGRGVPGLVSTILRSRQLYRYLDELVERRRAERGEDLLTAMISAEEEGQRLSRRELVASVFLLLFAGHETTVNLIANGMLALLDHPEQRERLRREPELIDSAVEELLRFVGPVQTTAPRYATRDVEIAGVAVPRGAPVAACIGSASRDEAHFRSRRSWTWRARRTGTAPSASARTTAWARRWRGWRRAPPSSRWCSASRTPGWPSPARRSAGAGRCSCAGSPRCRSRCAEGQSVRRRVSSR